METSKRKFKRFDLPLTVKFRPTHGATQYHTGVIKNFSCEGLGLEAQDFNFIRFEKLELNLGIPEGKGTASLFGDVIWKRQDEGKSKVGIKLKMKDKDLQSEIKKISSSSNIPINNIYSKDPEYVMKEEKKIKPASKPAKQKKKSTEQPEKTVSAKEVKKGKPLSKPAKPKKKRLEQTEKVVIKKNAKKIKPVSEGAEQKIKPLERPGSLGFIKEYNKSGSKCKVTFRLPKESAPDARHVTIVGDFNKWDISKTPMTRLENGDFLVTLNLNSKREYKFRYLVEGRWWENDWRADRYVPNAFGSDDSVVIV